MQNREDLISCVRMPKLCTLETRIRPILSYGNILKKCSARCWCRRFGVWSVCVATDSWHRVKDTVEKRGIPSQKCVFEFFQKEIA
jgi:hypothetical protein